MVTLHLHTVVRRAWPPLMGMIIYFGSKSLRWAAAEWGNPLEPARIVRSVLAQNGQDKLDVRQEAGAGGRAREARMVQKVLLPSLSRLPRSVRLSEGVEVLMRTRNNKTKRPSVTRPDRQHYNNSFNRTPAPLFIVHTLCTHAKSDAEADLSVADRLASLYCNCATACTTTSFPNLHPATKISNRLTQRHVVNVTSLQE